MISVAPRACSPAQPEADEGALVSRTRVTAAAQFRVEVLEPRLLLAADWAAGFAPSWTPDADGLTADAELIDAFSILEEPVALAVLAPESPGSLDLDALRGLHTSDDSVSVLPLGDSLANAADSARLELVVIDASVEDYQQLLADLRDRGGDDVHYEVHVIESTTDGVQALSQFIAGFDEVDAVHVVSHGSAGSVQLGNTRLDAFSVNAYAETIRAWSGALANDADLLFYGCDFADSADGRALVETLAALTGADVAASTDATGEALLGGDWILEHQSGDIESTIAFSTQLQNAWGGVLATFTVNTLDDTVDATPGDGLALDAAGNTSLRAAIMEANVLAGADSITLAGGPYILTLGADGEDAAASGDLDISSDLTIIGAGAATTTIDGDANDRVFDVRAGTVVIEGLTIQNGEETTDGGGGIRVLAGANLSASGLVVSANSAANVIGGGLLNEGTATILHSTFESNDALDGGAIRNAGGATLIVDDTTIRGNSAGGGSSALGGGLDNRGVATVSNTTFSGNDAKDGGGVSQSGGAATITLSNTTFSGNTASDRGGGLAHFDGTFKVINTTVTTNDAGSSGGGMFTDTGPDKIQASNTIAAYNTAPSGNDVKGAFVSDGSNIIMDVTGATGFAAAEFGIDPLLDTTLQDNGGATFTHALLAGSPAIDPSTAAPAPSIDQRGFLRDSLRDIGAFEFSANASSVGLWISTSGSGSAPELSSWGQSEIIQLADPDLAFGTTSDGTWSSVVDFSAAAFSDGSVGVFSLHRMSTAMTLGGNGFPAINVVAGDLLLTTPSTETWRNAGPEPDVTASSRDVVLFHPDTPGDYSAGTFTLLLESPVGTGITGLSLVEADTQVGPVAGGTFLPAGTILVAQAGNDIRAFTLDDVGASGAGGGTAIRDLSGTPGATTLVVDGEDIGIFGFISGVELIERDATVGGVALEAGDFLLALYGGDAAIGDGTPISADKWDVIRVRATATGATTAATAITFLDGNPDVHLELTAERIYALALADNGLMPVANAAPVLADDNPMSTAIAEDNFTSAGDSVAAIVVDGSITDADGGPVESIAITAVDNTNGSWQFSTDNGGSWSNVDDGSLAVDHALLLDGTLTGADTQKLRFVPDPDYNGSADFTFRAWDMSAGVAGSYADTSGAGTTSPYSSATDTASIAVNAVNDAPVIDPTGAMRLNDVLADSANPAGNTVAEVIASAGGDRITDADAGALEGIAVIGVDDANGTWEFSTDGGGSWTSFVASGVADGATDDNAAVLLAATDYLRFVPDASYTGNAGDVTFRAWDHTSASSGDTGIDVSSTGSTSAFSDGVETATLEVIPAAGVSNQLPMAQALDEDTTLIFSPGTVNGITVSDRTGGDTDLRVTLSVPDGTLTLSGTAGLTFVGGADGTSTMTFTGLESAINAALDGLIYAPAGEWNGVATLTVDSELAVVPVALYTFEDPLATGNDDSPAGANDGVPISADPLDDPVRGNVLEFDGVIDHVRIPGMFGQPASLTLAGWVNLDAGYNNGEVISLGNNVGLRVDDTGGGGSDVIGFFFDGVGFQATYSGISVSGMGWHHVAFTVDTAANEQIVYVDGVEAGRTLHTQNISYSIGSDTYLGRHGNGSSYFLHGLLDDVRVYDSALPAEALTALAADGVASIGSVAITVEAVNDEPSFTTLGNQNVLEDAGAQTVAGFATPTAGGGADENTQTFSYTVNNNNAGLFAVGPAIDANGQLTYKLASNAVGTATVTVAVTDSGGTANPGDDDTSPAQTFDIIVGGGNNDAPTLSLPNTAFINEFHYDNVGTDSGEFVEIAALAGTDLSGWSLVFYNGNDGMVYGTTALSGVVADLGVGMGALAFNLPPDGIQNGDPGGDGIALVDAGGNVLEFISYEGTLSAVDGPAAGMNSTDLGVAEDGTTPIGDSLQQTGSGTSVKWAAAGMQTPGLANTSQDFAPIADALTEKALEGGTLVFSTSNGNAITVADPDAGIIGDPLRMTLTVSQGSLSLAGVVGLTGVTGDGTAAVSFEGTAAEINAAIDGLAYQPTADFAGSDQLTIAVDDGGNTGTGGALTDSGQVQITVLPINDEPSFTTLGDQNVDEDSGLHTVAGFATPAPGGGADESAQTFSYTVSNDNAGLFAVGPAIDANGQLTYTLAGNANGSATVTVSVTDSGGTANAGDDDTSPDQTFDIIIVPINDEPSFTTLGDQNVDEDSGPHTVVGFATPAAGGGADESAQTFSYTVSNDNAGLFAVGPAIDANGQLTYTLAGNANGSATVTVSVKDSGGTATAGDDDTSPDQTFDIIVAPLNDEPSFTTLGDQNVDEDSGPHTVAGFASALPGGGTDENTQTFSYTVSNDNAGLFAVGPAIDANGQLTYTLAGNANGSATVTVSVTDSGGTANAGDDDTSPDQTFDIIIAPLNDEPSFTTLGDQNVNEDSGPHTVAGFATPAPGGGADESAQTFSYTVSNDNAGLFAVGPAIDANGQLTYTLAGNANGSATVTVSVKDSGGTASVGDDDTSPDQTFDIIIAPINDEPSFTTLGDQNVDEDAGAQTVAGFATALPGGGADESAQTFSYAVSNDNAGLFAVGPAIDANGQLTYTLAGNANGSATVTVSVTDSGGTANAGDDDTSPDQTFDIIIAPINDEPSFTTLGDQNIDEDSGPHTVAGFASALPGGGADESAQTFSYTVSNDNAGLFAVGPAIDANGQLTYTLAGDANGSATVTVSVSDTGGTANVGDDDTSPTQTFDIIIAPINDEPSFSMLGNQNVDEDTGPHTVAGFATPAPGGGADESAQTFSYTVSNDNAGLFAVGPAIDANGQLTYTLAGDAAGTATVTVSVTDSGGTANAGDDDTSPDQTFDIIIAPINDEPSFTTLGDQNVDEDAGAQTVAGFATALPGGGADESAQTFSYAVGNDNAGLFAVGPAIDANGQLTYTLAGDAVGTATVTVSVTDSGGTANAGDDDTSPDQTFDIIITPINDEPSFTTLGDQNVDEDSGPHTVAGFASALPGGGTDEAAQTFTYTVSNDNAGLFTVGPAIDANGQLTYTLAANAVGTATVTVSVSDSGGTANAGDDDTSPTQTFDIIIAPINDEPSFTTLGDQNIDEDSGPHTVAGFASALPGGGADESAQTFSYTVSNDNAALFTVGPAIDANGQLTYTLAGNANGSATVTVSVTDSGGTANAGDDDTSPTQTFDIIIAPINDEPSFTTLGDQNIDEDSGPHTVAGFASALPGGGADESAQTFSYTVSNDNAGLFAVGPAIDANGQLTYTLAGDANGSATVTVSVSDTGGTANVGDDDTSPTQTFDIIIAPINDEPSFTTLGDQMVLGNSGANAVSGFALPVSGGGSDENMQTFSYTVSNDNPGLFAIAPAIDASGQLTYTLAGSASGTATVTVSVTDSGGTANSGDDTSPNQTFDIVAIDGVTVPPPAPDPPSPPAPPAEANEPEDTADPVVTAPAPTDATDASAVEQRLIDADAEPELVIRADFAAVEDTESEGVRQPDLALEGFVRVTGRAPIPEALLVPQPEIQPEPVIVDEGSRPTFVTTRASVEMGLDRMRDAADEEIGTRHFAFGQTTGAMAGLSVGYVSWLLRGGVLLSSVLSSLPAWRFIDPLPVFSSLRAETDDQDDDDNDDESLEAIVETGAGGGSSTPQRSDGDRSRESNK